MNFLRVILLITASATLCPPSAWPQSQGKAYGVPILLYHRFADTFKGPTTVSIREFEGQIRLIAQEGYSVIPLKQLLDAYAGKGEFPPPGSVVIAVDDGHRSFYDKGFKVLRGYGYTAALFVYPAAINTSSYAMNWEQLAELQRYGMEIQSHTFSHPNFRKKSGKSATQYEKFVDAEFEVSKLVLENQLSVEVSSLAYPYGIFDDVLVLKAAEHKYAAAFTIKPKPNYPGEDPLRLGRYTVRGGMSLKEFRRILRTSLPSGPEPKSPVRLTSTQHQPISRNRGVPVSPGS